MLTFIHVKPVASRALSRHCSVAVRQKRVHPRALIIPRFSDSPMELHSLGILDHVLQRFFLLPFYFHLFFFSILRRIRLVQLLLKILDLLELILILIREWKKIEDTFEGVNLSRFPLFYFSSSFSFFESPRWFFFTSR